MKTFSTKETLRLGWKAFVANLPVFITFGVAMLGIWLVGQLGFFIADHTGPVKPALAALVTIAVRVAQVWLQLGLIRMALKVVEGQSISTHDFLMPHGNFLTYLLATILFGVGMAIGLALLIVPGLLWAVRYGFYGFSVVDQHADVVASFKRSAALTEGVRWEVLGFGLVLFGLNILGAITLGVGLFVSIPVTAVAAAKVYRVLVARAEARTPVAPPAQLGRPAEVH